jgi:hypothetical protein
MIATTYGGSAANTTFYSATPLILADGDDAIGFVNLAGGYHTGAVDTSITFSNVPVPVANDIYLRSGAHLNFNGDLTLSTTSIEASGSFMINGNDNTLFLEKDATLPAQEIKLTSNLIIDGQGHTLTFNAATIIQCGGLSILTLKNMTIKGLTGTTQIPTPAHLHLQNCIIDIPTGTTWTYGGNNGVTITDDVIIKGGGTFTLTGNGDITISALSTFFIDQDTTFNFDNAIRNTATMSAASSTIHINGGTLKATNTQGLQLTTGTLILENKCNLNNGTNTTAENGIQFGDGSTDLTVKILSGANVQINGYVWYNQTPA